MPRTGRPRGFDREQALDAGMRLFWKHGYEATSIDRVKQAMGGLSSASFYAAFGSKEALFREAVARYNATYGQVIAPLSDLALSSRDALERTLRGSAGMQTDSSHPPGCLVALSAAAWSPESAGLEESLASERRCNRAAVRARVEGAVAAGELRADTDVDALTTLFDGLLVGFAVQARDGVPLEAMQGAITGALDAWDSRRAAA